VTGRAQLARVGEALYGPEWVSPLGRALGVGQRTIQRWAAGEIDVPARVVEAELPVLVARDGPGRVATLRRWVAALEALLQEASLNSMG